MARPGRSSVTAPPFGCVPGGAGADGVAAAGTGGGAASLGAAGSAFGTAPGSPAVTSARSTAWVRTSSAHRRPLLVWKPTTVLPSGRTSTSSGVDGIVSAKTATPAGPQATYNRVAVVTTAVPAQGV